jgi:hypothetical protein
MPKFIDRTGHRYGRLTVVGRSKNNGLKKVVWECQCDCGNTTYKTAGDLVTGNSVSCGCYLKERITKHGGWQKSSYNTWRAMMRRCYNAKDKDYKRYGGVGVTVCPEWHDYLNFAADMGEPEGVQTLDRIDPYGNYNKENCRWASMPTQARNTRVRATTKSGVTGVTNVYKNKWMAKITVSKKAFYSAVYDSLEEAAAARKELERKHWGTSQ